VLGELQRIVDTVAARVGRPALMEDRHQQVVVYSPHAEPVDRVRRESILRRHTTPEVVAFFRAAGVPRLRSPIRTPADDELGLLPRVCVPILHHDALLGFLWFIDTDATMSDQDVEVAADAAADAARVLHRTSLLGDLASQRETEATRSLLSEVAETRDRAAKELLDDVEDGPVVALVARGAGDDTALVLTRRWFGERSALHVMRRDHGVLLLIGRRPAEPVARHLAGRQPGIVVGIGGSYPRLADAAASCREAVHAARVAARLPHLGDVASWDDLGVYRALSLLDDQGVTAREIHPGLLRLLCTDGGQVLLDTLETYLDLAGNAHATAERLQLHRTTLYYRLQRVEQLAGVNLKDGAERLCLHLALKLARLAGPVTAAGRPPAGPW